MLSGGMRKRVAVARAMALDPELILFDEPTAGLDRESAREIATLLRDTHERTNGTRTTLVITHDLDAFDGLADRILEIDRDNRKLFYSDSERVQADAKQWTKRGSEMVDDDPTLHGLRQILLALAR